MSCLIFISLTLPFSLALSSKLFFHVDFFLLGRNEEFSTFLLQWDLFYTQILVESGPEVEDLNWASMWGYTIPPASETWGDSQVSFEKTQEVHMFLIKPRWGSTCQLTFRRKSLSTSELHFVQRTIHRYWVECAIRSQEWRTLTSQPPTHQLNRPTLMCNLPQVSFFSFLIFHVSAVHPSPFICGSALTPGLAP